MTELVSSMVHVGNDNTSALPGSLLVIVSKLFFFFF